MKKFLLQHTFHLCTRTYLLRVYLNLLNFRRDTRFSRWFPQHGEYAPLNIDTDIIHSEIIINEKNERARERERWRNKGNVKMKYFTYSFQELMRINNLLEEGGRGKVRKGKVWLREREDDCGLGERQEEDFESEGMISHTIQKIILYTILKIFPLPPPLIPLLDSSKPKQPFQKWYILE